MQLPDRGLPPEMQEKKNPEPVWGSGVRMGVGESPGGDNPPYDMGCLVRGRLCNGI